jgi:hypothetical protein
MVIIHVKIFNKTNISKNAVKEGVRGNHWFPLKKLIFKKGIKI